MGQFASLTLRVGGAEAAPAPTRSVSEVRPSRLTQYRVVSPSPRRHQSSAWGSPRAVGSTPATSPATRRRLNPAASRTRRRRPRRAGGARWPVTPAARCIGSSASASSAPRRPRRLSGQCAGIQDDRALITTLLVRAEIANGAECRIPLTPIPSPPQSRGRGVRSASRCARYRHGFAPGAWDNRIAGWPRRRMSFGADQASNSRVRGGRS